MTNANGYMLLIFTMLDEMNVDTLSRIVMIMWTIWWRRNQKCWNEQLLPVNNVIRRARDSLLDWIHTQKKHSRQQQQQQQQQQQNSAMACYVWTKPARGTLKCNFDTVCYDAQNLYCVGACIRDDRSMFVEAIMRNYNGKPLIAEAEAHGVLEVLQCCLVFSCCSSQIKVVLPCSQQLFTLIVPVLLLFCHHPSQTQKGHAGTQPRMMTSQLPHAYVVDHHLILNQHNITSVFTQTRDIEAPTRRYQPRALAVQDAHNVILQEVNQQVSTTRGPTRRQYNTDVSSAYYIQDGVFILDESISQVNQQVPTRRDNGGRSDAKLERIIIQQVPTDSEAMTCSICLVDFSVGLEVFRLLSPCLHIYHKDCILEWLDRSSTCPMCRRPVLL
ncbi:hypothetical protein TSUD_57770 [Trifolium subterraneum]|uniref:RING-type domain-containing protein n=1 Tax=Trifolium subterraneum TaxID=3900 RepID=A0A2Z6MCD8_TRISU|nr:hypothetical protein TSUD_57770 [Trifolium subterraneum]